MKKETKVLDEKLDPKFVEVVTAGNDSEILSPLINRQEFFMLASKTSHVETLGGFYSWLNREGMSSKLTAEKWWQLLSEFKQRKV